MRKPFKIALFVLILPILAFDFISYNFIAAQELNARYILPQVVKSAAMPVAPAKLSQSRANLCNRVGCTKA
jgi:hypothetical protein